MYLSRLILNPRSRQVQREIANPYEMHRTILRAFPEILPSGERVLFRLEFNTRRAAAQTSAPVLLVQSQTPADWGWLFDKDYLLQKSALPLETENPAMKRFDLRLHAKQTLAFRLRANPTVKKGRPGEKQGRRVGLYNEEDQLKWLERKLAAAGACLLSARTGGDELVSGTLYRDSQRHDLRFIAVQFDGLLNVLDPDKLCEAVANGIGSGKGLGFGLLSLAPISS